MNITVTAEKPENGKVVATITVPAAEVDKYVNKTYKDISHKYQFQGFRKGHTPRPVIDGIVGRDSVLGQATEDLMNDAQPAMLEELDIVPVENPNYGDDPLSVVEHQDFVVTATVTVPPTCELDSYDAPAINMPPEEATEAEIDQQLEQLMSYRNTLEDVEEDRPAEKDDVVVLDVEDKAEQKSGLAGTDRQLNLASNYLPEDFKAGVAGMKKGEQKDIAWAEGEGDDQRNYEVSVTLKGIKKSVTPELDDEFAKKNFGFDTVAELRDALKEDIENDKKSSLPSLKEDRVVEEIGKHLTLDEVPEAYQNQVFNELAQEVLGQLQRQGISLDMYLQARNIKSQDFINDLHEQAEERARQSLALDALADKLELEATEDDVRKEFEKAGVDDVDSRIEDFRKGGQLPAIRESIRRSKAVDWMVENAPVTVVDEVAEARAKKDDASDADSEDAE
ncbi:MAG: trigger factor [Parafannyhessea sp.]|uniref:trigger factor n=1 Tax=Parafannyhessea sp. TaxID=2847324 RepID=UPI003F023755